MPKKLRLKNFIACILISCIFAGCGTGETVTGNASDPVVKEKTTMLESAEIAYELPQMYPLISVDTYGYEAEDKKIAIIVSGNLPARFEIIDKKTGKSVYSGAVKLADIEEEDTRFTGYAEFTDFTEEGEYYLEADIVGCSKTFGIKKGHYKEMLVNAFAMLDSNRCNKCHSGNLPLESDTSTWIDVSGGWHTGQDGHKDVVEGCNTVTDLMYAYEYYSKSYGDNMSTEESGNRVNDVLDEIKYELTWLLKMQNEQTGGVYSSVSFQKVEGSDNERLIVTGETTKATAYFCAAMARFSYLCKDADSEFSVKCMKAANLAWKCLEVNKAIVGKDQMYRAAVEMYRATGYKNYSTVISDYLKENAEKPYENRLNLDGAISYLDTPRSTDSYYCSLLMAELMDKTEAHAQAALASRYLVEQGEKSVKELLRNACELAIVDYIISSSEYGKIEKNYLHYLGGRNKESIDYFNFENDPDSCAELILVLGRLTK